MDASGQGLTIVILVKKYIINRGHQGGRVSSIKLDGANDKSIKRNRGIRQDIIDSISKKRCAILDVGTLFSHYLKRLTMQSVVIVANVSNVVSVMMLLL